MAILFDIGTDYSSGLADVFAEAVRKLGGQIVARESFSGGDRDFSAQLTTIKSYQPDAIFIPAYYTEAGLIALQARRLGIQSKLIGTDGWDSPVVAQIGGSALSDSYYCTHFFPEDPAPMVKEFVANFRKQYKQDPSGPGALGYDAAGLLVNALKVAGADPLKIRDSLANTKNYPGVTGNISIDENRNAVKPAVVLTFENQQPKFVQKIF